MRYRGILFMIAALSGLVSLQALAQTHAAPVAPSTAKDARKANRALSRKVYAAIAQHKEIDAGNISVVARNGAITLDGTVREASQIDAVSAIARAVPGVTAVTNRLSVLRPMGG
ncbi:BON domain-containing protein [Paraburkholderia sp. J69-2]|uniref:BON domain-containing protein n=2 Tax=unclassified Paraburkholderia TaxID=2615204 RepID=UPI002AB2E332|nr:BON domain-containing protein [Paraburkholderia sp. J69-2]